MTSHTAIVCLRCVCVVRKQGSENIEQFQSTKFYLYQRMHLF